MDDLLVRRLRVSDSASCTTPGSAWWGRVRLLLGFEPERGGHRMEGRWMSVLSGASRPVARKYSKSDFADVVRMVLFVDGKYEHLMLGSWPTWAHGADPPSFYSLLLEFSSFSIPPLDPFSSLYNHTRRAPRTSLHHDDQRAYHCSTRLSAHLSRDCRDLEYGYTELHTDRRQTHTLRDRVISKRKEGL